MQILWLLAGLLAGLLLGWVFSRLLGINELRTAKEDARSIIESAKIEAEAWRREKQMEFDDELFELRQNLEAEYEEKQLELEELSKELDKKEVDIEQREEVINKKMDEVLRQEKNLGNKEHELKEGQDRLNRMIEEQLRKLEEIAGLTREQAEQKLFEKISEEARKKAELVETRILEEAKLEANRKAKEIVVSAIQQTASDQSVESTVSIINLPSDDMKGRIIGREGRNIRSFEQVSGVDIIIDDTPEIVVLSAYNPVRREIAKRAMEKLISDGRIHPARIEEVIEKTRMEMSDILKEIGEEALIEVGIHGVQPELMEIVGKLKFHTSYGQNVLKHSMEVAHLSGIIAAELGLDPDIAKRAGIFHDIGKAAENYTYSAHAQLGADMLKRFGLNKVVINAVEGHHGDKEAISPYPVIVEAADIISGSRPGARRESLEQFIRRMRQLEDIAMENEGVKKAYAIQAGKEIRVMVNHERISDEETQNLADQIANRIQDEIEYPGQVKVTVIRELRTYDIAT